MLYEENDMYFAKVADGGRRAQNAVELKGKVDGKGTLNSIKCR